MLTSLQNPLIKDLRKLQRSKYRQQTDRLLLEGTHLIEEAIRAGYPLDVVGVSEAWRDRHPQLLTQLTTQAQRVELMGDAAIAAISTTQNPDGIIASAPRNQRPIAALPFTGVGLALDTIQDPGNLGTILRTAVGAGVSGLWLSNGCVELDHPKVLRSSAGAWFRLPIAANVDLNTTIATAQQQGIKIVATQMQADCEYWAWDWTQPSLVLLGNEGAGLAPELQAAADVTVSIPIEPGIESLNVSIAAALILFEARRHVWLNR